MSRQVNMHEAKSTLSALVAAALRGEEIIIANKGKPQVKLVAVADVLVPAMRPAPGSFKTPGFWIADDFDDPLPGWWDE
jgi:prevent-host-death family protein